LRPHPNRQEFATLEDNINRSNGRVEEENHLMLDAATSALMMPSSGGVDLSMRHFSGSTQYRQIPGRNQYVN